VITLNQRYKQTDVELIVISTWYFGQWRHFRRSFKTYMYLSALY